MKLGLASDAVVVVIVPKEQYLAKMNLVHFCILLMSNSMGSHGHDICM